MQINHLRSEMLEDRVALRTFYNGTFGILLGERGKGFKLQDADYTYYLRCRPGYSDYDVYCFAYDNRYLLPELAGKHELPNDCFSVLPSTGELIFIVMGESGYYPKGYPTPDPVFNREIARSNNMLLGVTRAQEEAMLGGSLFGWNTDAAKPWRYESDGSPRPLPPRNREEFER